MRLINLRLRNFKGIREFDLQANGNNVFVYGDNATGKTTLFDACLWLKFGKDSQDKADFTIKTISEGKEASNLEHEVEGVYEIDGKEITLKRVYKEKYVRKRGNTQDEFSGHETNFYINEVPKKKREYEDYINSVLNEKQFKLLTNPLQFNALPWQQRREIIMEAAGIPKDDITGMDDQLKICKAKKAKINKELQEIPIRISEIQKGLPEVLKVDIEALKIEKENLLREIDDTKESATTDLMKAIEAKQREVHGLKMKSLQDSKKTDLENLIQAKNNTIDSNVKLNEIYTKNVKEFEKEIEALRENWKIEKKKELIFDNSEGMCQYCGQKLPENMKDAKESELRNEFEGKKKWLLDAINSKGKIFKGQIESFEKSIKSNLESNEKLFKEVEIMRKELESIEVIDYSSQIQRRENEIRNLKEELSSKKSFINELITPLIARVEEINKIISLQEVYTKSASRVEELKSQEKKLANQFLEVEKQTVETENLIRDMTGSIESKINSMFKTVSFKLFNIQINGGIEETFETLVNGVPWQDANGAAKINSGIEIINVLSGFYKFWGVIFVDNLESVTRLQETHSQVIGLIVSEKDKKLRVEVLNES